MLQRIAGIVARTTTRRVDATKSLKAKISSSRGSRTSKCSLNSSFGLASHSQELSSLQMNAKRWYCAGAQQPEMPELQIEAVEPKGTSDELTALVSALTPSQRRVYERRIAINKEMSELRKRGEYSAAVEVYKRMLKEGIDPDHFTYTQVLNLYAMLRRPTSAEAVWDKMLSIIAKSAADPEWNVSKAPKSLTLPTINAMIHMYCQSSNITEALKLYEETTKEWNLKPDAASIQPILWYFAEKKDVPAVERLYFDFKQKNPDWQPSMRMYTLLIGMYGKEGHHHHIARLLEEIKTNGTQLDPVSVSVILKTLISTDEEITSDLILKLADLSALESSFSLLARDLTTKEEASTLLASMKASNVPVTAEVLNSLISRVSKTYEEAKEFVQMMEEEYEVKASATTFDALLQLAATPAHRSKMADVAEVSKEIERRGILPSEATMCLMIRFYSQIGEKSMAEQILEMLKSHNPILSPKTHNAVVRMYAFGGPYEKLLLALKNVQDAKIQLDPGTVDIMFQSMMRRGKYLDAANMITTMIHLRQRVQMKHIISLFANTLARAGRTDVNAEFYNYSKTANPYAEESNTSKKPQASHRPERTPAQIDGDINIIMNLHTVLNDTPGVLMRAPAEYFAHVLSAAEHKGVSALCRAMHPALRSHLSPEDRTAVFVEFLKSVEKLSFNYAHDIAAWKQKLEGEGRTNPLVQSQYQTFVKYVQNTSKSSVTGSRVNRPQL